MRRITLIAALLAVAALALPCPVGFAADWPPTRDEGNTTVRSVDGRTIERFTHGARPEWGYPPGAEGEWDNHPAQESGPGEMNHNSFYLVAPKQPRVGAPLCVVLHSANRTAYDYLGYGSLDRKVDPGDDPPTAMTSSPADFYALYLNSTNAEWWGGSQPQREAARQVGGPAPAELRVMDTIEWVATHYPIDRNRIYLCGASMGGCGSLGIGMPHGDVFAAVRVMVPAGTDYFARRMGGVTEPPAAAAPQADREAWLKLASGAGRPDPPVVVDFSSPQDNWSSTQPLLLRAAQEGHLPLVLTWGPFGHTAAGSIVGKYPLCEVALAFPWLEIRKDEAYPVFTRASIDQRSPWLVPPAEAGARAPAEVDAAGQINAWFRWKSERDTPKSFAMRLWIARPVLKNPPATMPETATADVTPRRLQQFKVEPGASYAWQLVQEGRTIASGKVSPDLAGLLTIPRVALTTAPSELSVKRDGE